MKQRSDREGGFALLLVFLLAAAVAFTLYQELPRAAFESARDKEQLLIDRGNQYKRAIQVFYAVNKRFPADLKDLENTNEKRYLRRRYKDPMTGSDQWRLIHTNGSVLTDSLVQKPPAQNAANGTPANGPMVGGGPLGSNNLNTAAAPDATATDANGVPVQTVNAATLRRPSDRGFQPNLPQAGGPAGGNVPGGSPFSANSGGLNSPAYDPGDPRTWPAITLTTPTQPGTVPGAANGQPAAPGQVPGQPPGTQIVPGAIPNAIPGQLPGLGGANPQPSTFDPSNPAGSSAVSPVQGNNTGLNGLGISQPGLNQPGLNQPGLNQSGNFGPPFNQQPQLPFSQPGGAPAQSQPAFPAQPSTAPQPQAGPQPPVGGVGGNPATQFINNQLFSPAQAGTTPGANAGSAGPGIAGVASMYKGPSIKSYQKRTKYQEWEFVFDPASATPGAAAPGQAIPGQANPNQPGGAPGLTAPGQPGTSSPFGQNLFGQPATQPTGQPTGSAPGQPSAPFQ